MKETIAEKNAGKYGASAEKRVERQAELHPLAWKIYIEPEPPTEEDPRGDRERILEALPRELGNVRMPLSVMRTLYPMCREAEYHLTVTIGWNGTEWEALKVEAGDTSGQLYGLAVDYGSTTIVMEVVDLCSGEVLTQQSMFNPQIRYGEEILSRIFYTKENRKHLEELQRITAAGFCELIETCEQAAGIPKEQYAAMTVGGNTTMIQFLLGVYPWPVFETPFAPAVQHPGFIPAQELGIAIPGYVYLFPSAANYLGGDVISGLVAAGLDRSPELSVFIDIGTNGELVAGNSEFLLAGAGAAGPALEGGISQYGMRADHGAIDRVKIRNGEIEVHTIGEEAPRGICGSGIVDLLSELFLEGWVDSLGRLNPEASKRIIRVKNHLDEELEEWAVCYVRAEDSAQGVDLVFTQTDLSEFIATKAAAHTMVEYLIEAFGLEASDISRFYLAGAFGRHLDLEAAITIGMYPDLPREKFVILGNSSLDGAREMLLDLRHLEDADRILKKITYVQFGNATDFMDKMNAAMFLPYTDTTQYPSVITRVEERRKK